MPDALRLDPPPRENDIAIWTKNGEWHRIDVDDYTTKLALVSTDLSDFTEAAQDAAGAMAANSSKVSLTYTDGTPSLVADIVAGSLGAADIANRTRRIDLPLGAGVRTGGTGTNLGTSITYVDAETGDWRWATSIPSDLVTGTVTLYWQWTTATTAANCLWGTFIGSATTGEAQSSSNKLNTSALYASHGTTTLTQTSSIVSTSSVTAGAYNLLVLLRRTGGDATDAINANVQLVAVWLEYTADS